MDQDATWYGGRPRPRRHCVRWGPRFPKKGTQQPPIFGPCLWWANGQMDQEATWYGGRPQPRPHCVRTQLPRPERGTAAPPLFGPCLFWPYYTAAHPSQLLLSSLRAYAGNRNRLTTYFPTRCMGNFLCSSVHKPKSSAHAQRIRLGLGVPSVCGAYAR